MNEEMFDFRFASEFDNFRNSQFPFDILCNFFDKKNNNNEWMWITVFEFDKNLNSGKAKLLNKPVVSKEFMQNEIIGFKLVDKKPFAYKLK